MLKRAEPPICVGLYARWGSGKTFMISLLKKEFDPDMHEDQHTKQLLQFFEEGYRKPEPEEAAKTESVCSLIRGLLFTILLAFVPAMPYGVATFLSVICDAFDPRDALNAAWAWCSSLKRSCARCKPCAKTAPKEYQPVPAQPTADETKKPNPAQPTADETKKPIPAQPTSDETKKPKEKVQKVEKEYVFVDFNAWE